VKSRLQPLSHTAIIYLGTRGGPVRQLKTLLLSAAKNRMKFTWIASSNIQDFNEPEAVASQDFHTFQIPNSKFVVLFNLRLRKKFVKDVRIFLEKNGIRRVYFLLPHPWDISLSKQLYKKTNIQIWRGVHDVKRHPGDLWPSRFTIHQTLKYCHTYVAFSDYIAKELLKYRKQIVRSQISEVPMKKKTSAPSGSVLFVGRIRKYKGLYLLAQAWPLVDFPGKSLTVAGEGNGIPFKSDSSIKVWNHWLTDVEIDELVQKHRLVVLPYIEASQSGIIPIANSCGVPVVVTPVGGLVTQVVEKKTGLIAKSLLPADLARAITEALQMEWHINPESSSELEIFLQQLSWL
jgi:glycosyltransferase involved in cell wall biosynthesis